MASIKQAYTEKDEINLEPSGGVNFILVDNQKVLKNIKAFRSYQSEVGEIVVQIRKTFEDKTFVASAKFSASEMKTLIQNFKSLTND